MSQHRLTLVLDIDDEALNEHVDSGRGKTTPPYTKDISEWDAADIFCAYDEGIVNAYDCYLPQ